MEKLKQTKNSKKSDLYKKEIHNIIPGGCHTYSKGDDTFPINAPAAISHGKGAYVWDIDGNKFLDVTMGLTSVTLGHAFNKINKAVTSEINKGVNFQRPSYIEREFAKLFLDLIPNHQMIKFAKNGSTVTTSAIKLARAYSNRKLIAFPEDHPFFSYDDWFIGSTKCSFGVPNEISNLSVTFKSCSLDSLKNLFNKYPGQIAGVIMEPKRNNCDNNCNCSITNSEYLKRASNIIHENNSVFILDEMITGFKESFPGVTVSQGINSDITTWGKSISNGFSFACMTGKSKIMNIGSILNEGERKFFMSSTTHGGETIGIRAAIETVKFYKENDVIQYNQNIGREIFNGCIRIIKKNQLEKNIYINKCYWMLIFNFNHENTDLIVHLNTLFSFEMIKHGVLIQNSFLPSFSFGKNEVKIFLSAFSNSLKKIKTLIDKENELRKIKPVKKVFRKLI